MPPTAPCQYGRVSSGDPATARGGSDVAKLGKSPSAGVQRRTWKSTNSRSESLGEKLLRPAVDTGSIPGQRSFPSLAENDRFAETPWCGTLRGGYRVDAPTAIVTPQAVTLHSALPTVGVTPRRLLQPLRAELQAREPSDGRSTISTSRKYIWQQAS